jgi:ATP-binding cassette subfamily G (WHITE) protein 2 (PDR)
MATFLCGLYFAASEWIPLQGSKGEVLIFPKGHSTLEAALRDEEFQQPNEKPLQNIETPTYKVLASTHLEGTGNSIQFLWDNLTYDISTNKGPRRLLHGIQGWVRQGSLTAVMVCFHMSSGYSR